MDNACDILMTQQRSDVPDIGKLGKIDMKKLVRILKDTDIIHMNTTSIDTLKNKCWLWQNYVSHTEKGHSHPQISFKNKYVKVHRLLYHNFIEDVPPYERKSSTKQVNHKCSHENNGLCVNPWHCYLGTPKDNMQDAINDNTKNKPPKGENNWQAKLSDNMIREIRNMKGNTILSQKEIAAKYGVHQTQISRWWRGTSRN
jgi:DNA-binding transcriptional regulator YiaG